MGITLEQVKSAVDNGTSKSEEIREEVAQVGLYLKKYFDSLAKPRLDKLEAEREKKEKSASVSSLSERISEKAEGFQLPKWAAPLIGLPAALAGLRALPRLGIRPKLIKGIGDALKNLMNRLREFGRRLGRLGRRLGRRLSNVVRSLGRGMNRIINPIRNAIGRILRSPLKLLDDAVKRVTGRRAPRIGNISKAIGDAARSLRTRLYRMVGLGPDGKLLALRDMKTGRFRTNNIGRAFQQIGRTVDAISDWAKGTGAAVTKVFRTVSNLAAGAAGATTKFLGGAAGGAAKLVGSGVGGALKVIGKVLWPISILFALYDGVQSYQNEEGDQADKIAAGVAGFLGDIVGAPLNLLKDVVSWTLKEMGFEKAGEFLDGLDIEQSLKDTINKLWDWFRSGLRWVGTLLTDPVEALTQLWNGLLAGAANLGEWLWNNGLKPLGEWFLSILPNPVPWLQEKWAGLLGAASDLKTWVWDNTVKPVWDWFSGMLDITWPEIDFSGIVKEVGNRISNWFYGLVDYIWKKIKSLNPFSGEADDGKPMEAPSGYENMAQEDFMKMAEPSPSAADPYAAYYGDPNANVTPSPSGPSSRLGRTLTPTTPKISAEDVAAAQAWLDQVNSGQTTAPMTNVIDGSSRVDNSVRQTTVLQQGANNVDPNAYAVPGFGPR